MLTEVSEKKLTYVVLATFMCEVCAIVNAWPIVAITSDPTKPFLLTPALLLTQKGIRNENDQQFLDTNPKDLFKEKWRCVQCLTESFWTRWKQEYLQTLQSRRKWERDQIRSEERSHCAIKGSWESQKQLATWIAWKCSSRKGRSCLLSADTLLKEWNVEDLYETCDWSRSPFEWWRRVNSYLSDVSVFMSYC